MNELALIFDRVDIDTMDVIEAALQNGIFKNSNLVLLVGIAFQLTHII